MLLCKTYVPHWRKRFWCCTSAYESSFVLSITNYMLKIPILLTVSVSLFIFHTHVAKQTRLWAWCIVLSFVDVSLKGFSSQNCWNIFCFLGVCRSKLCFRGQILENESMMKRFFMFMCGRKKQRKKTFFQLDSVPSYG